MAARSAPGITWITFGTCTQAVPHGVIAGTTLDPLEPCLHQVATATGPLVLPRAVAMVTGWLRSSSRLSTYLSLSPAVTTRWFQDSSSGTSPPASGVIHHGWLNQRLTEYYMGARHLSFMVTGSARRWALILLPDWICIFLPKTHCEHTDCARPPGSSLYVAFPVCGVSGWVERAPGIHS